MGLFSKGSWTRAAAISMTPAGPLGALADNKINKKDESRTDFDRKSPYEKAIENQQNAVVGQLNSAKDFRAAIPQRVEMKSGIQGDAQRQVLQGRLNKARSGSNARGLLYSGIHQDERLNEKRQHLAGLVQARAETFDAERQEALDRDIEALKNDFALRDTLNQQRAGDNAAINQQNGQRAGAMAGIGSAVGGIGGAAVGGPMGAAAGSAIGGLAGGAMGGAFGGGLDYQKADISREASDVLGGLQSLSGDRNQGKDIEADIEAHQGRMSPELDLEKRYRESLGGSDPLSDALQNRAQSRFKGDLNSIARQSKLADPTRERAARNAYGVAAASRSRTLAGLESQSLMAQMQAQAQRGAALSSIFGNIGEAGGMAAASMYKPGTPTAPKPQGGLTPGSDGSADLYTSAQKSGRMTS